MLSARIPAIACASAMTSACPSTPGAVYPTFNEPSLLTADPLITARIRSPSATPHPSFQDDNSQPSPQTVPRALASKARQWPSGEFIIPSW